MIGKVMDGQLGALSRYGYSWDKAQEKVLKYGNELERANMLAEVIGQSVGGMNAELAKTPAGQLKQLEFTFAGIREQIGAGLTPVIATVLPYIQRLANWLAKLASYFSAFMQAFFGIAASPKKASAAIGGAAEAQDAYGNSAEKAGKKAKKAGEEAKRSIAGFDEINTLSKASSGSVGGAGVGKAGGGVGDLGIPDMSGIDTASALINAKMQALADNIKDIFKNLWTHAQDFGSRIGAAFSGIRPALQPLYDAVTPIKESFKNIGVTATQFTDNYLKPMTSYVLFDFIPTIVTGFTKDFAPVVADIFIWLAEELDKTFKNLSDAYERLWNRTFLPSLEKIKGSFLDFSTQISSSLQNLLDGTIKPLVDYMLNEFIIPISENIDAVLVPIFTDILTSAFKETGKTFDWLANLINDIYNTLIQPAFDLLKKIVLDTLKIIEDNWKKHGKTLLDNISGLFNGIRNTFQLLWDKILKPIVQPFLEMLSSLWDKHLKGLVKEVGDFVMKLVNGALEILNKFILPIVNWLIDKLGPVFSSVFSGACKSVETVVGVVADVAKGLFKSLGGIVDFITGVFSGNWSKAWQGVKDIFGGIFSGLYALIKMPLNSIIDGVNAVISGLNKLKIPEMNIPGFGKVGGWGINIPKIPRLAKGGYIGANSPVMAMIGDNRNEGEIVAPESKLYEQTYKAIKDALGQSGGEGNTELVINFGSTTVFRGIIDGINMTQRHAGKTLIEI
jgi:phage-related protein